MCTVSINASKQSSSHAVISETKIANVKKNRATINSKTSITCGRRCFSMELSETYWYRNEIKQMEKKIIHLPLCMKLMKSSSWHFSQLLLVIISHGTFLKWNVLIEITKIASRFNKKARNIAAGVLLNKC